MNAPDREPWYRRPLPLPSLLPGWLAIALVIGASFAVTAYFFINVEQPSQFAAYAFVAGFALMVLIFSLVPNPPPKPDAKPPSFSRPPIWVSLPVIEGFLMFAVASALRTRSINLGRGGRGPRLHGDEAVAFGWLLALAMLGFNALLIVIPPRKRAYLAAGILGFLVVGGGLVIIM